MSLRADLLNDPRRELFDQLDRAPAGMLGIIGSESPLQPMKHFADLATSELWFVTSKQTDFVRSVGTGSRAHYCLIGPEQDFHACMTGTIVQSENREKLDSLWSPAVRAWFPERTEDPDISLLQLKLQQAALWASDNNLITFGFEMLRANMSADHAPDLGDHVVVNFGNGG